MGQTFKFTSLKKRTETERKFCLMSPAQMKNTHFRFKSHLELIIQYIIQQLNYIIYIYYIQERALQNITNYLIVSLAVADLLVAGVVMPFYTYTLVSEKYFISDLYFFKIMGYVYLNLYFLQSCPPFLLKKFFLHNNSFYLIDLQNSTT